VEKTNKMILSSDYASHTAANIIKLKKTHAELIKMEPQINCSVAILKIKKTRSLLAIVLFMATFGA
jgi:hypothetical protein